MTFDEARGEILEVLTLLALAEERRKRLEGVRWMKYACQVHDGISLTPFSGDISYVIGGWKRVLKAVDELDSIREWKAEQ